MFKHAGFLSLVVLTGLVGAGAPADAALATDVKLVPFYDTSKVGLSFAKDKQALIGMYEVPGKPQHFLVLGFSGFVWSLYPDTTKTYAPGAIKDYAKKQVADFNASVLKGWEQGAYGAAFDPRFTENHFFYILSYQYADKSKYHTGTNRNGNDGQGAAGLVVIERWKLSSDFNSLTRDTVILSLNHGTGYGVANLVFGKDSLLYIAASSYSQNSWDSTNYMRKILRIDIRSTEAGRLYSIPPGNPFFNATNPAVKKEIFAFGIRNTWSLVADYLTGSIWGSEIGQGTWEEINIIKSGNNYGWSDGGDGESSSSGVGIEGPCSPDGGAVNGSYKANYSFSGAQNQNRTFTCRDFTNGTWNFSHSGKAVNGVPTALDGLTNNCIVVSPALRGDPTSPLYGYHFVTDVNKKYYVAVKEGVSTAVKVGQDGPQAMGDNTHNGPVAFSEDAYGNMYVIQLGANGSGFVEYYDILRMAGSDLKPLATPRTTTISGSSANRNGRKMQFDRLLAHGSETELWVPGINGTQGFSYIEIYNMQGQLILRKLLDKSNELMTGGIRLLSGGIYFQIPKGIPAGTLGVRFKR